MDGSISPLELIRFRNQLHEKVDNLEYVMQHMIPARREQDRTAYLPEPASPFT